MCFWFPGYFYVCLEPPYVESGIVSKAPNALPFFYRNNDCLLVFPSSNAHDPQLHADDAEFGALVAQRLVTERLASRTMSHLKRVVQPEPIVATARANAEEPGFAVHAKVVQSAIGKRLEANPLAKSGRVASSAALACGRRWCQSCRACVEVGGVGRGWRWERCECRGTPEEALAVAKV